MQSEPTKLKKLKYFSSVSALNLLTLLLACFLFRFYNIFHQQPVAQAFAPALVEQSLPTKPVVAGRPIRLTITSLGIDLPVDEGFYSASDNSWTLSGYHAQFAMLSNLANDSNGNTFIYGHNNRFVFGPLKHINPYAQAQIYTDNNHIFSYVFQSTNAVTPDNTKVLDYQGPPILTIQTCSGAWNENRQMYVFKFSGVLK